MSGLFTLGVVLAIVPDRMVGQLQESSEVLVLAERAEIREGASMTTPSEDSDARLLLWGLIALAVCAIAVLFAFTIG